MKTLSRIFPVAAVAVLAACGLTTASSSAPGGQAPPIADRMAFHIDSIFSDLDSERSPGCAVGVYEAGEILFAKGYGMASLEHGIPMSPRSVLGLASVSKQFTALAIVLLDQRGDLSLDDHVRQYIPELPEYAAPVTIRHLIHHTSGLRDNVALLRLARENIEGDSDDVILSMLGWQNRLNFEPGQHWMYNSGGYSLLAMIVERVTGVSFPEFTEREIFAPLGMTSSGFRGLATTEGRALAYEPYGAAQYRLSIPTHSLVGPAGLYSTIEDLARWDRNFYDMQVGGGEGVATMHVPGRLISGQETTYASGLRLQRHHGLPVVVHSGFDPGYTSMMIRFPDQRLTVAVLCNTSSAAPWTRAYAVADVYLERQFPDGPGAVDVAPIRDAVAEEDLEALAGIYQRGDGAIVHLGHVGGTLNLGGRYELTPIGDRRFQDDFGFVFTFSEPSAGGAMTATVSPDPTGRSLEPLRLERIGRQWDPAPEELAEVAGFFFSEELDSTWQIVAGSEGVRLRRWGMADQALDPLIRDMFTFRGALSPHLHFARDAEDSVTGFSLSSEQILGVEFVRRD
jgi:CubicO group peptidase (beta-lactamase class C family)